VRFHIPPVKLQSTDSFQPPLLFFMQSSPTEAEVMAQRQILLKYPATHRNYKRGPEPDRRLGEGFSWQSRTGRIVLLCGLSVNDLLVEVQGYAFSPLGVQTPVRY
jgi:hypothetical protein